MARPRRGYRVLGPYKHRKRWRIKLVGPDGRQSVESFSTEDKAKKAIAAARRRLPGLERMEAVLLKYEKYLVAKGNKTNSVFATMGRLQRWFPNLDQPLSSVTSIQMKKVYEKRSKQVATDTHNNELIEVKTFCRWCAKNKLIASSPAEGIEPVGRRSKGKAQLRRNEASRFFETAFEMARDGDQSAVAALSVLLLGLRSGEIRMRKVRDIDAGRNNVLLWIENGKTDAATRHLELPPPLDDLLVRQAEGKNDDDWVFPGPTTEGYRTASWLRKNVRRICAAAGVPVVCPHGLRGTWATLATDAGVTGHVVARELGHTNPRVTQEHYTQHGATERAQARKMFQVVEGGRK